MAATQTIEYVLSRSLIAFVIEHDCNWLDIGRCILFEPYPRGTQPVREVETIRQTFERHAFGVSHPQRTRHRNRFVANH